MRDRVFRVNQLVVENKDADDLTPITFANLGFLRERDLRPWIENEQESLGENLLVVQRAHTVVRRNRLRLDILAVARDGALVVIEVKLRDSDDDPRWQAFLHAAACGQRSEDEIIELYAAFKGIDREKAAARLKEHTDSTDEQDLKTKLNHCQRVVLVARSFRKQVTTAALWLREQGIDVSCIRLTPLLEEQTGACYMTRTELTPGPENLLVDLLSTLGAQEREAERLERHREQIDEFWQSLQTQVKKRLEPELTPSAMMDISDAGGARRWFRLRYQDSPWNAYFIVRAGTTEERFRVTALLQWNAADARSAGMSKPAIDKLRRLTAAFAEKPGWNARMGLAGYYEAGKTVEVTLDNQAAERAADVLDEVVRTLYPRMEQALGRTVRVAQPTPRPAPQVETPKVSSTGCNLRPDDELEQSEFPGYMFRVLRDERRVTPEDRDVADLKPVTFKEHGFYEVTDLHPWLAYQPQLLGEDLLVVASTPREHIPVPGGELSTDILAVDRDGALVVVEVKLDWSGGTVYWQAARYAAAYWKFSPDQIIDIYAEFNLYNKLNRVDRAEAIRCLMEHTGAGEEQELKAKLNHRQRIVLVAREFFREDTATSRWLKNHGVEISFLKLTPYRDEQTGEYYVTGEKYVRNPKTERLTVDLLKPQKERLVVNDVDDLAWVTRFARSVADKVKERLDQELWHAETSKSAKKMADFRYFALWRAESPWYGFYIFVRPPEDDRDTSDLMRVTLLFQFSEARAKEEEIDETAIGKLQSLAAEFAARPDWCARKMHGFYEAGKTVHVALDEPGAELAAETLAEVIREMYPRIEQVLDKPVPATGGG